jgi:hypothetical protein
MSSEEKRRGGVQRTWRSVRGREFYSRYNKRRHKMALYASNRRHPIRTCRVNWTVPVGHSTGGDRGVFLAAASGVERTVERLARELVEGMTEGG